jgi:ribulose-5-phosphate 4-epimerase/fuculose-1-phosphate aldolase
MMVQEVKMPTPIGVGPEFKTKEEEREYQKIRLALAFRIFAKLGFEEGVAGHITLRVSSSICSNTEIVMTI